MTGVLNPEFEEVRKEFERRLREQLASLPPPPPPSPSGIKLLYNPPEAALADVVSIHGLTGHREKTWTSPAATEPWPKSLLPATTLNVRALTFGYDASVTDWKSVASRSRVGNHAQNLLNDLANFREEDNSNERPLIFVCHGLGGLVCEDALVSSNQRAEKHLRAIFESTKGILFLGTPHHGPGLTVWAERLCRSIGILGQTDHDISRVLRRDSEVLSRIQDSFHTMIQLRKRDGRRSIEITCFYEELPVPGVGLIVPRDSAFLPGYIPIGIRRHHQDLAKFASPEEAGFMAICATIRRWVKDIRPSHTTVPGPLRPISEGTELLGLSDTEMKRTTAYFVAPHPQNLDFVGRVGILEQLKQGFAHKNCFETEGQRRLCLHGVSGIGKTQIALEYAHWLHGVRPDMSIYWVYANSKESFQQSFAEIAQACGIPGRRNPSVDILSLVKMWLQNESHGTWFLVVDNADDPNLFSLQSQDADHPIDSDSILGNKGENMNLAQFLPNCRHGSVLVTTRNKQAGMNLVPGRLPIEVEKMKDVESAHMIRLMTGDAEVADDKILLLSSRLDFLPLALAQASAFMLKNSITLDRYLALLDGSDEAHADILSQPFEAAGRDRSVPRAVMLTWVISFEQIKKENELASTLLSLMALFDYQAIPKDLLVECWTSVGVLSSSRSLSAASSLKRPRSASPDALFPEETLASIAVEGGNSKESVSYPFKGKQRGSDIVFPELTEAMKAHLRQSFNTVPIRINPTFPDYYHIEQYSYDMLEIRTGMNPRLTPSFAADQVEDASSQEHTDFPTPSTQPFSDIWSQSPCVDDLEQYVPCKEDRIRSKSQEMMLPNGRRSTLPIGYAMPVQQPPIWMFQYDADLHARFTRIRSTGPSIWEDNNSRTFFIELEKALGVLKALGIITERSDGSVSMHRLVQSAARRWLCKGFYESSFEREALHAMVRAFPVAVYENLDQCKTMLPHVHAILRSNVAETSQNVLIKSILYENMARFYINAGQAGVVPQLLQRPLAQAATQFGEDDPLVLQMIRIMAVALCDQGRLEASKPWLSRLMALEKKCHEGTHPQMLRAMSALAVLFHMERKYRQAESILTEAMRNIDNFQCNHALRNMRIELTVQLVGVLISSRRLDEALSRSSEAVDLLMIPRCYGLDHPVALENFAAQAVIFREQGEFGKAEVICRQALEGRDIVSDPAQPYLLSIMGILGKVLMRMHRFDEAQQVCDRILHIKAQTCQPERITNSQPKEPSGLAEPEELPIYKLGASVRSFDSSLLETFEDHATITSHNALSERERWRRMQTSARSHFQAPR